MPTESATRSWLRAVVKLLELLQEALSNNRSANDSIFRLLVGERRTIAKRMLFKKAPHLSLNLLEKYFRVEVEGLEHIPSRGSAIILPNHSGFLGLDALILRYLIYKKRNRVARILLHRLWFTKDILQTFAKNFGFVEATYKNGLSVLAKNKMLILFPEAEQGNFKTFDERYQLQPFKTGSIRMAIETGAPVVPVLIIGAEETHINIGKIFLFGQLLPLPLNCVPLPAKWKIKFLKPVYFSREDFDFNSPEKCIESAEILRRQMQTLLLDEVESREYVYF